MFRRVVLITAALAALGAWFGVSVANAQDTTTTACATSATHDVYGCKTPGFILNPPTTNVGGQVTISGTGCDANQDVIFTIDGQEVARTVTDANGDFNVTFVLPTSLGPGSYTIVGTCGDIVMSNVLTIEAAGTASGGSPGGGQLVQTGSSLTVPLIRAGLVLIVLGGLSLILSKRRRGEPEVAGS